MKLKLSKESLRGISVTNTLELWNGWEVQKELKRLSCSMTSLRFKRISHESMRSSCSWRRWQRNKAKFNLQIWPRLLDHWLRHQRPSNRLLVQINLASCTVTDSWMRTLNMLLRSNLRSKSMSSQMISPESWLRDRSSLSTMKNRGNSSNSKMMLSGNLSLIGSPVLTVLPASFLSFVCHALAEKYLFLNWLSKTEWNKSKLD